MSLNKNFQTNEQLLSGMRIAVVSPVRDEGKFIRQTMECMVNQTIHPVEYILVNDGSTDDTQAIIEDFCRRWDWIKLVNRSDRGSRQRGKGVVEAFYAGFAELKENYDFVCKFDGDITFDPDYFEAMLNEFTQDPALGIAGGGLYEKPDDKNWVLYTTEDHVRGCLKMYRRECFEAIGGLSPSMGWDGIDEWKALSLGWKIKSFLNVKVYHYRFTGAATGFIKSYVEQGQGAYRMGYHPLYLLVRGLRRMGDKPLLFGGLGMIWGYIQAWLRREPLLADKNVIHFIRQSQMKKLTGHLFGKSVHQP